MAKTKTHTIRLLNSGKQLLALQVRPPGGDFFLHEQQVRIRPGQSVLLPKDHLMQDQIRNLTARRMLKVVYDSELAEAKAELIPA